MNQTETNQTILELMNNSILLSKEETNQKILKIMNKDDDLLSEEIQLFKELMFRCDLKIQNKYGHTPLIYALRYNQEKTLKLNELQWDYLFKNSDLKQKDNWGWTPLMIALIYNKDQNLNLSEEQFNYLIKNSDLIQQNNYGYTALILALQYNKTRNLNLSKEQINYLIKNSDLKQQTDNGWTTLIYALTYNKTQNLKLTKTQFQEMYNVLNEDQQQITFQKLIQENVENDHQYQEKINLFLYDFQFKPHEKTLHWLKENKHQDILERIEKRNLFFQLNQDLKEINNVQKIAKIKL